MGLGCAAWIGLAAPAGAQAVLQAGSDGVGSVAPPALGEVVVTARGRPERDAEVPSTLTVFTATDLQTLQPHDLGDLAPRTPGLVVQIQYPTNPTIVLRGLSTDSPDPTREPRVSVYQDGVYFSRPQSALFELFDVERVEIVKGPQTTQFGRGALAGAINVVTNKAELGDPSAGVRVEGGDYDHRLEQLTLNAPLGSQAAIRLAVVDRHTDGYVDNLAGGPPLNGASVDAGRISLAWRPSGTFSADLILSGQRDRFTSPSTKSGVFNPTDAASGAVLGDTNPYRGAFLQTAPDFPLGQQGGRRTLGSATFLASYAITPALKLQSTTAYTGFRTRIVSDYDGTSLGLATSGEELTDRQISEDVRLTFDPGGRWSASVGASYAHERASQAIPLVLNENEILGLLTGVINRQNPSLLRESVYNSPSVVRSEIEGLTNAARLPVSAALAQALAANFSASHFERLTRSDRNAYYDVFAGATFRLTEQLRLEAGARVSHADKITNLSAVVPERSVLGGILGSLQLPEANGLGLLNLLAVPGARSLPLSARYPIPNIGLFNQPTATPDGDREGLSDTGASGQISLVYSVLPRTNLYLSYGHGRQPSVLSAEAPSLPGAPARFGVLASETLDSIEAGTKAEFLPQRLSLDASVFQLFYRHFDTVILRGTTLVETDAGRAGISGVELSGRGSATSWADINLAYSYTHARFGSGLYEGNHFRLSPDHTLYARADLHASVPHGVVHVILEDSLRSRVYFDDTNGNLTLFTASLVPPIRYKAYQDAVNLINLRLSYKPARSRWRAEVAVTNLAGASYIQDVGSGSLAVGLPSYIAGRPRVVTFALSLQWA